MSAIFVVALAIAGFTPHYLAPNAFEGLFEPLTPLLVVHATLMGGWMIIFLTQSVLISVRRVNWHKSLGLAAAAMAILIVAVGCMTTLSQAARAVAGHTSDMHSRLNVLGLETAQMLLFGGFVAAGTMLRTRPDLHKRLMLLATLCILPNAIVRLSSIGVLPFLRTNAEFLSAWTIFVLGFVVIDRLRIGRLHNVFARGVPLMVGGLVLMQLVSTSDQWVHFWVNSLR
jgi:hypothetical protein